jgi:hypothetical protein
LHERFYHWLIQYLILTDAAAQLIENPASKSLLITVLRSGSMAVREMAADFAIQVGKSQPVVFGWLLAELKNLNDGDMLCEDTFRAMSSIMESLHSSHDDTVNWKDLASILIGKLFSYSSNQNSPLTENKVLIGHLRLFENLIKLNYRVLEQTDIDINNLTRVLLSSFLFTLSQGNSDQSPICNTTASKQAVFAVLTTLASYNRNVYNEILSSITTLAKDAAQTMRFQWGLQISHDVKRANISLSGLTNQGCTCYMNSLLQQLFLNVPFREAILLTPLKECHRTTLWHLTDEELVGCDIVVEFQNGLWKPAKVIGFTRETGEHQLEYLDEHEKASFNIREGRVQRETGRCRIAPKEGTTTVKMIL